MSTPSDDELYDIAKNVTVEYPLCLPGSALGIRIRARAQRRALYEAGQENPSMAAQAAWFASGYRAAMESFDWLLTDAAIVVLNGMIADDVNNQEILKTLHAHITGTDTEEDGDG